MTGYDPVSNGDSSSLTIGERVRRARESRQLSLRTLADLSGCSPSSISQIERGKMNPRIGTLLRLMEPLDMTVAQLMSDDSALHRPLRVAERVRIVEDALHHEFALTRRAVSHFEVFTVVLQPGGVSSEEKASFGDSQIFCLVQRGSGTLELGEERHELHAGDSMEYLSSTPERMTNTGTEELEYLWVISPPSKHRS